MVQTLTLCDEYGIIYQAMKVLPDEELKIAFLREKPYPLFYH